MISMKSEGFPGTTLLAAPAFRARISISAALLAIAGCSLGRVTSSERTTPESSTSSVSMSLHKDEHEAALGRGKEAALAGRFDEAAGIFERVAADRSAKSELREQALLQLGSVFTNVLNPTRDEKRARGYYQALLDDFPESKLRTEAQQRIDELQPSE